MDVIVHTKGDNAPNFTDSFTASGIKSVTNGEGDCGYMNFKRGLGPRRTVETFTRRMMNEDLHDEWYKIPLFVSEAMDWTPISTSVGFTASGKSSVGGPVVAGRDLEKYATIGVFTAVRNTQATLELLASGNPNVDLTQCCFEMLWIPTSRVRLTMAVKEILTMANLAIINSAGIMEGLFSGDKVHGGHASTDHVDAEALVSIHASSQLTQVTTETLANGDPRCHMSQVSEEILVYNQLVSYSNVIINDFAVESLRKPDSRIRVSQVSIEELFVPAGKARIDGEAIETIHNNNRNAVVDAVTVEEVNNSTTMKALCNVVAVEMLVRPEYDPEASALANNPHYHI